VAPIRNASDRKASRHGFILTHYQVLVALDASHQRVWPRNIIAIGQLPKVVGVGPVLFEVKTAGTPSTALSVNPALDKPPPPPRALQ